MRIYFNLVRIRFSTIDRIPFSFLCWWVIRKAAKCDNEEDPIFTDDYDRGLPYRMAIALVEGRHFSIFVTDSVVDTLRSVVHTFTKVLV